jgi:hypothetical protein
MLLAELSFAYIHTDMIACFISFSVWLYTMHDNEILLIVFRGYKLQFQLLWSSLVWMLMGFGHSEILQR